MGDMQAFPACGGIPEERVSFPYEDEASLASGLAKSFADARMLKNTSVTRQWSTESDDRASCETQIIACDTSGENSGVSGSSGDETPARNRRTLQVPTASGFRRSKQAYDVKDRARTLPRSASSSDVSRVSRPSAHGGTETVRLVTGAAERAANGIASASSVETFGANSEQEGGRGLRRALTHFFASPFESASGNASDGESSNHSSLIGRDHSHWLHAQARLRETHAEVASLSSSSPVSGFLHQEARPANEMREPGESKTKRFLRGALEAVKSMKKGGRQSKGGADFAEILDGEESRQKKKPQRRFHRQSSVGAERAGEVNGLSTRSARRRNQSCMAEISDVGGEADRGLRRERRPQRTRTYSEGLYASPASKSLLEGVGPSRVSYKRRTAAAAMPSVRSDSFIGLASHSTPEISVVSSAMPAMQTAMAPAVLHQIAPRSEAVVACHVPCPGSSPLARTPVFSSVARGGARASAAATVQPAGLAAMDGVRQSGYADTLLSPPATPGNGVPTTPASGVATTPRKSFFSSGGSPFVSSKGGVSPGRGSQRQAWWLLTENMQDVLIGVLVLVSVCSLFLGKIPALVTTLAAGLLASRVMPQQDSAGDLKGPKSSLRRASPTAVHGAARTGADPVSMLPAASLSGTPNTENARREQQIAHILQYSRTTDPKSRQVLQGLLSRPAKAKGRR